MMMQCDLNFDVSCIVNVVLKHLKLLLKVLIVLPMSINSVADLNILYVHYSAHTSFSHEIYDNRFLNMY